MYRTLLAAAAAFALAPAAQAHFVFLVPAADGKAVTVVFSEDLEPDENVTVEKIVGLRPTLRDAAGKTATIELAAEKHTLKGALPGTGPRAVYGSVPYGVMARGNTKPFLLVYHPKALVGPDAEAAAAVSAPLEVVPVVVGNTVVFRVLAAGKPVADAEVNVLIPGGKKEKVKTDKDGITTGFAGTGRFAVYAKHVEAKTGEYDGKNYDEVRHYATLVFDAVSAPAKEKASSPYPPLPVGVSSLGAVVSDGYLYVYGGHSGKTHDYDTKTALGTFHRLKLDGGTAWEPLPGGPGLQGMNLAAHGGKIYRVGGMQPRNTPGEPGDLHSVPDAARFDPSAGKWEALPPLPAGRSSHDVVVVGDNLVVVGGWDQRGKDEKSVWPDTAYVLGLSAKEPKWETVPQPFKRRALTAAAAGGKVYVVGGLSSEGGTEKTVNVFDVATRTWATGPDLPGTDRSAFSPAATTVGGRVAVCTSAGVVYRLSADGTAWEKVGTSVSNRMVARLVPVAADAVALVGGASRAGNAAAVEVIKLSATGDKVSAATDGVK